VVATRSRITEDDLWRLDEAAGERYADMSTIDR
jgi:hypothetical protein